MICDHDTIAAPATAAGGALAVIRVSGGNALTICDRIFRGSAPLADAGGYTVHYGHIMATGERSTTCWSRYSGRPVPIRARTPPKSRATVRSTSFPKRCAC